MGDLDRRLALPPTSESLVELWWTGIMYQNGEVILRNKEDPQ